MRHLCRCPTIRFLKGEALRATFPFVLPAFFILSHAPRGSWHIWFSGKRHQTLGLQVPGSPGEADTCRRAQLNALGRSVAADSISSASLGSAAAFRRLTGQPLTDDPFQEAISTSFTQKYCYCPALDAIRDVIECCYSSCHQDSMTRARSAVCAENHFGARRNDTRSLHLQYLRGLH